LAKEKFFTALVIVLLTGVNDSWAGKNLAPKKPLMPAIKQTASPPVSYEEPLKENFSGSVSLSYSGNMFDEKTYDAGRSVGLEIIPVFILSEYLSLTSKINVDKEFQGQEVEEEVALANVPVGLSYKKYKLFGLDLTNRVSLTLPLNELIHKRDSYNGAVGVGSDIEYSVGSLNLKYGLTLTRNIHEYEVSAESKANIAYILSHAIAAKYEIGDVTLAAVGTYKFARTYNNFERTTFIHAVEAEYKYSDDFAFMAGTGNEGNSLRANGKDSNLDFFNENTSVVYAGLGYSF
jgi:hypothetical protein